MSKKCKFPPGLSIRPNGKYELDPCRYEAVEKYRNVSIEILRCRNCGNIEISWYRQENTEKIDPEEEFAILPPDGV